MNREKDITREERELLTLLRARPSLYLGNYAGLHELQHFLDGYEVALRRHHLEQVNVLPEGFDQYVADRLPVPDEPANLWTRFHTYEPDDRAAMELFWLILNEYLFTINCHLIPPPGEMPETAPLSDGISMIHFTDLPRLAESYMRTFNGTPWWDRWDRQTALERLRDIFRTPGFNGVSVWQNGEPLGAVMGRTERYYDGDCFQIIELWVEPRVQREGWGGKLLTILKDRLRRRGIRKIFLLTMPGESTEGFYRKHGFSVQHGLCVMQLLEEC